jgi:hypothetical protein
VKDDVKQQEVSNEIREVDSNEANGSTTPVGKDEWSQASRAMRTASWSAVFYLITTDILGPSAVPWSLANMGWGPGLTLYTVFGAAAV